ncbi:MAG: ISNCY family transposase [bacterium]
MVTLSQQEEQRAMVLNALDRRALVMVEAAGLLGLSTRQIRRLRRAYRRDGPKALVHGNRGRPSPRRVAEPIRARVVHLAQTLYAGVNHKHLSELLAEREAIVLSHPTVHRILREAGIRSPRRRRPPRHRRRRERMPQPGLLVQLDGSDHDWLEERGPRLVLLAAVDDATGEVVGALFREQEDGQGYFLLLREIATHKGVPVAVYSDRHGIFKRDPRTPWTLAEQLKGGPEPTQVARALRELGIRWIPAASPQAKGRIERLFGAFQDRLRSELRLAGIADLAGANAYLPGFLTRYNARFAQRPQRAGSAFRPWPALDPETIFCFKYVRTVSNDNTVTLGPHLLQLAAGPHRRSYARARVEVHERLDGSLAVFYHGRRLEAQLLTTPAPGPLRARRQRRVRPQDFGSVDMLRARRRRAGERRKKNAPPPADHPWRKLADETMRLKAVREAGRTKSLNP